jgi:hypothetical protein
MYIEESRLCGLVVRVPGYTTVMYCVSCEVQTEFIYVMEKSSGSCLENLEYGLRDPSRRPRGTLYPQKLAVTSPTSGGRSVGIVRSRTQTMEFFYVEENRDYGRRGSAALTMRHSSIRKKLTLTSPTSGGRLRTQATELLLFLQRWVSQSPLQDRSEIEKNNTDECQLLRVEFVIDTSISESRGKFPKSSSE